MLSVSRAARWCLTQAGSGGWGFDPRAVRHEVCAVTTGGTFHVHLGPPLKPRVCAAMIDVVVYLGKGGGVRAWMCSLAFGVGRASAPPTCLFRQRCLHACVAAAWLLLSVSIDLCIAEQYRVADQKKQSSNPKNPKKKAKWHGSILGCLVVLFAFSGLQLRAVLLCCSM